MGLNVYFIAFFILICINKPTFAEDLYSSNSVCGIRGDNNKGFRIVNGTLASKGEFPWLISLRIKQGFKNLHVCGGVIINKSWVVTAAHCVHHFTPQSLIVVAGDYNIQFLEGEEQVRRVTKIVLHNFDLPTFTNDIALLKLEYPLDLSQKNVMPICLPKNFQEFQGTAIVAGWGFLSEIGPQTQFLHFIELPILPKDSCDNNYRRVGYSRLLHQCQLCAGLEEGGKDSCQGDSGGPLVCQSDDLSYTLCGLVSWGIGCARKDFPGMYTKVSCYVEWIRNIVLND